MQLALSRKLAEASVLLALLLAACFFNPLSSTVFEPDKVLLIRCCASAALAGLLFSKVPHRHWPLAVPALLVLVSFITSSLWSQAPLLSVLGNSYRQGGLLTEASYIVLGAVVGVGIGSRQRLLNVIAWSSLPVCLYAIVQHAGLDPIHWSFDAARPFSLLGNPDFLASYLAMVLPLTAYLAVKQQLPAVGLVFLQAGVLWLTAGRSGFLALIAASVVLLLIYPQTRKWSWLALGPLSIVAALTLPQLVQQRVGSMRTREAIWLTVAQAVPSSPVIGHGPQILQIVNAPGEGQAVALDSHDSILDALYERGLFGLGVTLMLVIAVASLAWKYREDPLMLALSAALLVHAIDSLFSVTPVAGQLLAYVLAGAVAATYNELEANRRQTRKEKMAAFLGGRFGLGNAGFVSGAPAPASPPLSLVP